MNQIFYLELSRAEQPVQTLLAEVHVQRRDQEAFPERGHRASGHHQDLGFHG